MEKLEDKEKDVIVRDINLMIDFMNRPLIDIGKIALVGHSTIRKARIGDVSDSSLITIKYKLLHELEKFNKKIHGEDLN